MSGSTRYFGLGYFDFGDDLGSDFSQQIEIDRFVFIDRQLYGLMSVLGNGVINGWAVTAEEAFAVSISEGYGNINFTAARTTFPDSITDLPPRTISYVYAKTKDRTTFAEDIEFVLLTTPNVTDPHFLLLAEVVVGASSIESIDNSVRQEISFIEIIKAAIRLHKHRGGSLNPSKIDLSSEVKGQLPAFRIADFDAEKIVSGTFDLERLPLLSHSDLDNIGLLTHPQLDSFVKTLESNNTELFGEIGTANLLQLVLAMKLIHDDATSAFYWEEQSVDKYMINEIAVIPGITPDSLIDFDNTTAEINTDQHYIKGIPPSTGTSFYVRYNTDLAWKSVYSLSDLIVVNDTVTLGFNEDDETNIVTIEGFESATANNQSLAGGTGGINLFRKETIVVSDNADIVSQSSATNVIEGFYSGKFTHRQSFRTQFVKEFSSAQDWSTYDSFVSHSKCLDSIHGPVKIYFESSSAEKSIEFVILDEDEVTFNSDSNQNNFETRVIDLSLIPFRNDIKKLVIFTDDITNPFSFLIDFINIQRAVLLPEEGQMKIRYSTSNSVIFYLLEWDSTEPAGTNIAVRARSSNGTVFLTRADFTPELASGNILNLRGTDLEIEITFRPDSSRILAPTLNELKILILSESEIDGFNINSKNEFVQGTAENVDVGSDLELDTPIYVGSYYFCLANAVNQINSRTDNSGNLFSEGELALFGLNSPISPNQIFAAVENNETRVNSSKMAGPRAVQRRVGRSFIVADTYNDRVLEYDEDGNLLNGLGSINYEHTSKTFPISSCFDIRTGILYIVWSRKISFKTVNISKIILQSSTEKIQLIRDFDKILGLTTSELDTVSAEGQIMPVYLADQNAVLAENLPTTDSYLFVSNDAVSTGVDADSVFYTAISSGLGIPMFVGNFAYLDGVFTPTSAQKTDDGSFVIGNATIAIKDYEFPSTVSESITKNSNITNIIEVDSNNNVIFGANTILFSPFIPGKVEKIDDNTLLLAGLRPGGIEGTPTGDFNFRVMSGTSEIKQQQKSVLESIFFGGSTPFVGAVVVLDTRTKSTSFEYISAEGILVSDVDVDPNSGEFVVAESSFNLSGRIIKVDAAGNITFSFGEGLYSLINSLRVKSDSSIVIST